MAGRTEPLAARIGRGVIGAYCRRQIRRSVELSVEGRANVPRTGPVLLVARHVHHLFDGCILTTEIGRPLHAVAAVDWVTPGPQRRVFDLATGVLRWPTIVRNDTPSAEARRRLAAATREAIALLADGQALLIFPEAYPNVDPRPTPKTALDDFLPFRPGFTRLAALAERAGASHVPIVPIGFWYGARPGGWDVVVRFGKPVHLGEFSSPEAAGVVVESRVRALSVAPVNQPRLPRGKNVSGT